MLRTLTNVIQGKATLVDTRKQDANNLSRKLRLAGINVTNEPRVAKFRMSGQNIILYDFKVVTRRSGRNTHLSRYAIGVEFKTINGRTVEIKHEIFIDRVDGLRSMANKAVTTTQKVGLWLAKTILGSGLSSKEIYA